MGRLDSLGRPTKILWITIGFLLLFVIGILDYFTGSEISFSLFYVFPIALISRLSDWRVGSIAAIVGAANWITAEMRVGNFYSHPAILYWNAFVRLSIFLLMAYAIQLGRSLEYETAIARTDFVTGAFNSRYLHERLQIEIDRSSRYAHPCTLAYLDIDNFKNVNDRFGHRVGDQALRAVVDSLKQTLRKTDIVARAGGDEFVILLPETDQSAAQTVIAKAFKHLSDEMKDQGWPITISAGTITFSRGARSVDAVLELADGIMYEVKAEGKNNVVYVVVE